MKRSVMTAVGLMILVPVLFVGFVATQSPDSCIFSDGQRYVEWQGDPCEAGWKPPNFLDHFWPPEHWPWNARVCHPRLDRLQDEPCPS